MLKIRHHQRSAFADPFHPHAKSSATQLTILCENTSLLFLKHISHISKKYNLTLNEVHKRDTLQYDKLGVYNALYKK